MTELIPGDTPGASYLQPSKLQKITMRETVCLGANRAPRLSSSGWSSRSEEDDLVKMAANVGQLDFKDAGLVASANDSSRGVRGVNHLGRANPT